ncbi:unnamed protein product [Arabis nemorensis]|uniref:Uncharacterized protein n=1 Tax=Arabis nemorensis TaxID=586526 RepID=A0A565CVK7_9BRAS|nr:unnamed protein product [Arabis nemorensis]
MTGIQGVVGIHQLRSSCSTGIQAALGERLVAGSIVVCAGRYVISDAAECSELRRAVSGDGSRSEEL